jgi:hypothetical protein
MKPYTALWFHFHDGLAWDVAVERAWSYAWLTGEGA